MSWKVAKSLYDLPEESGIYVLCFSNIIIYVGQTISLRQRVTNHANDKRFYKIYFKLVSDNSERIRIEKELIETFLPIINKQFKPEFPRHDTFKEFVGIDYFKKWETITREAILTR